MTANPNYRAAASRDLQHVLDQLHGVEPTSGGYQACCPAHEDANPSLSISTGNDGRTLLYCHAGCAVEDVVAAIGITMSDLMGPTEPAPTPARSTSREGSSATYASLEDAAKAVARGKSHIETVHEYPSADGTVEFAVVRIMPANGKKTFRPVHRANGKWSIGDPKGLLPLFRLPTLAGKSEILVVEGEKCAEAAAALGFVATTSAHGAISASKTDWSGLAGKNVVILPDNDEAGRNYANDVIQELTRLSPPASVRILDLPNLPPGGDIVNWLEAKRAAGGDTEGIKEDLCRMLEAASGLKSGAEGDSAYCAYSAEGVPRSAWPNPKPIQATISLPAFPIESFFPKHISWIRDYCVAVSEGYQFPIDAVVMMVLPCMALALSKRFEIQPQPMWSEPISIYTISLLPSGERKSSCLSQILRPIYEWQRQQAASMGDEIAQFHNELKIAKAKLAKARDEASNSDEEVDSKRLLDLAKRVHELEQSEPRPPQFIVTEATSEALVRVLVENGERALLAAAEGDALEVMLGRYSRNPNMGIWLSGHAGDSMDIIRLGRPADRLVRPSLQVCLCVQPTAIHDLLSNKNAEGLGLLARFLFVAPTSMVGYRKVNPTPVPEHLRVLYERYITYHLGQPQSDRPRLIRLTEEASRMLDRFREQVEVDLRDYGLLSHLPGWGSKLPGTLLRIAGVLAAFPVEGDAVIDAETLGCALSLRPYLFAHYEHVLEMAGANPDLNLAKKIDHWLIREGKATFSLRDAYNRFRGPAPKAEQVAPALQILVDLGRIRALPMPQKSGPGRSPSPCYELNPALLQIEAPPSQNTHNTQNPPGAAEAGL